MLVYGVNGFPGKRVPEILTKLSLLRFFKGGLTYSDLTDRPEAGELYEAAATFMYAWNEAERIERQRAEGRARR